MSDKLLATIILLYFSAFDALGGKELIMLRMASDDANVRYEALIAVQKLMVHNW